MRRARHLVIFVKAPEAGRVKTRLAATMGAIPAAQLYRRMMAFTIARLRRGPWHLWLAVSPDAALSRQGIWPGSIPRVPQGGGDLGARLRSVARSVPPGPVVIIGSDCPAVTPGDIETAFRSLTRAQAVLGPAEDGGYWLIGIKRPLARTVFQGVRWSGPHAMADTLAGFRSRRVAFLRTLRDVDTTEDLAAYKADAGGGTPFLRSHLHRGTGIRQRGRGGCEAAEKIRRRAVRAEIVEVRTAKIRYSSTGSE